LGIEEEAGGAAARVKKRYAPLPDTLRRYLTRSVAAMVQHHRFGTDAHLTTGFW
jgi:hypothetical protein